MKYLKKLFSLCLVVVVAFSMQWNIAFAKTQESTLTKPLEPTSIDMMHKLDEAANMLVQGLISEKEYTSMLLDIYQLDKMNLLSNTRSDHYYPEVLAGYINYDGVVYLYEEGLDSAKTIQAAILSLMGLSENKAVSWGLGVISTVISYSGKSAFEKAVDEAYFAGKGIKVYYQIHVSVQSYDKVRYVIE